MYKIRRTTTIILLLCIATAAQAQFGWQWISGQPSDGVTQWWMRRTYTNVPYTDRATITVATNGYVRLYVNGRQTDASPLMPPRTPGDTSVKMLAYDVSPYIVRTDSLQLALWCATAYGGPCAAALRLDASNTESGSGFSVTTDSTWLCRPAAIQTACTGAEWADATQWQPAWSYGDTDWARWAPAHVLPEAPYPACTTAAANTPAVANTHAIANTPATTAPHNSSLNSTYAPQTRVACTSVPKSTVQEGGSVVCSFDHAFIGFIRITLRDAVPGETIYANGMRYVCNGEMDEQLAGRFAALPWRTVIISGDRRFKPEQIQSVEGLEVEAAPYKMPSFCGTTNAWMQ